MAVLLKPRKLVQVERETIFCSNATNVNDSFVPSEDEEETWSDLPSRGSPHENSTNLNESNLNESNISDESPNHDIFEEVRQLRNINRKRPILGYLNINSIRYKFAVAESKIDMSFSVNLFCAEGYKLERRDRNTNGGGIMTFVRADLPIKRRLDLECPSIETLCNQLELHKRK